MGALIIIFVAIGIITGIMITIGIVCRGFVKSNNIGEEIGESTDFMRPGSAIFHAMFDDMIAVFSDAYKR
ncbi:MAG: hypothetical protein ACI4EF_01925 [Coprococcus sp.]